MGYRISWLAVENVGQDRLLATLAMANAGILDEANEADFSVAELPTGWTVLWANDEDFAEAAGLQLSHDLSPVLVVRVDETCMHSTAALLDEGKERWRLHHEGDHQIDFLQSHGVPPVEALAIEAQFRARQAEENAGSAEVDYVYEIPLEVARAMCGYRHDHWSFDWGEPSFHVAESAFRKA